MRIEVRLFQLAKRVELWLCGADPYHLVVTQVEFDSVSEPPPPPPLL